MQKALVRILKFDPFGGKHDTVKHDERLDLLASFPALDICHILAVHSSTSNLIDISLSTCLQVSRLGAPAEATMAVHGEHNLS